MATFPKHVWSWIQSWLHEDKIHTPWMRFRIILWVVQRGNKHERILPIRYPQHLHWNSLSLSLKIALLCFQDTWTKSVHITLSKYNFLAWAKNISRWAAQIAHQGQLAHHIGKRQAALPVTPGNIPGLVPGSPAAAQWWDFLSAPSGTLFVPMRRNPSSSPIFQISIIPAPQESLLGTLTF